MLWQQKFKQMWLKEGDRNTGFFHRSTIQNWQKNRITHLKSQTGRIVEKQSELEQHLVQLYSNLLHETDEDQGGDIVEITSQIPKLVTLEHNILLMRIIEREEVEETILQMEKGKAPRLDGFIIDFF